MFLQEKRELERMRESSPRDEDGKELKFGIEGGLETVVNFTETMK